MASPQRHQAGSSTTRHSGNASYNNNHNNSRGKATPGQPTIRLTDKTRPPVPLARRMTKGPLDSDEYA